MGACAPKKGLRNLITHGSLYGILINQQGRITLYNKKYGGKR